MIFCGHRLLAFHKCCTHLYSHLNVYECFPKPSPIYFLSSSNLWGEYYKILYIYLYIYIFNQNRAENSFISKTIFIFSSVKCLFTYFYRFLLGYYVFHFFIWEAISLLFKDLMQILKKIKTLSEAQGQNNSQKKNQMTQPQHQLKN